MDPVERSEASQAFRDAADFHSNAHAGEQLKLSQPLKQLAERFPWVEFEKAFGRYYSVEAKPVRLMVELLLLKLKHTVAHCGCTTPTAPSIRKRVLNSRQHSIGSLQ